LLEVQKISLQMAMQAGVKIAMGTDLGSFGHGQNAGELAYLVEAGMSSMQAIVAATNMGARCMGLGDEIGLLAEGRLADLLVVEGDPLQDVNLLQERSKLRLIMKDGAIIKNTLSAPQALPDPRT
jgi:imidazolonepropionase-like amidohydrolase